MTMAMKKEEQDWIDSLLSKPKEPRQSQKMWHLAARNNKKPRIVTVKKLY